MSLLTWVLIGVVVWLVLLGALMAVFFRSAGYRQRVRQVEIEARRVFERRRGRERRIGLPDPRTVRVERRRGPDRRRSRVAL